MLTPRNLAPSIPCWLCSLSAVVAVARGVANLLLLALVLMVALGSQPLLPWCCCHLLFPQCSSADLPPAPAYLRAHPPPPAWRQATAKQGQASVIVHFMLILWRKRIRECHAWLSCACPVAPPPCPAVLLPQYLSRFYARVAVVPGRCHHLPQAALRTAVL
jgi:hypothetical protein